jgi:hypothetical protein
MLEVSLGVFLYLRSIMDVVEYIKSKCIADGYLDGLYQYPGVSEVECEAIDQRRWVQVLRAVYKVEGMDGTKYVAIEFTEPLTEMQEGSQDGPEDWAYYEVTPQEVTVIKYVPK